MIKRTQFKCCFVATLAIISIIFCTLIAIVVYQSVVSYTGLNQTSTLVSDCSTAYLNLKLVMFSTNKLISFVFICLQLLLTIICFILILVGFIKFRENIIVGNPEKQELNSQNTTVFFSLKGLCIVYVMFSLALLCNLVHFGIMFAYVIQYANCKATLLTQPLVLAILSGITLLFYLVLWIILNVVIYKINNILQNFQVARKKQKIYTMVEFTEMNMNEPEEEVKENTKKPLYGVNRRDFATYKRQQTERTEQNKSQSDNALKDQTPKFVEDQHKKKAVRETVQRRQEKRYSQEKVEAYKRQETISPQERDNYVQEQPYFKSKRKSPFYEEEGDLHFQKKQKESNLMWTNKSRELVQSPEREEVQEHSRRKRKSKILLDIIRNKYAD